MKLLFSLLALGGAVPSENHTKETFHGKGDRAGGRKNLDHSRAVGPKNERSGKSLVCKPSLACLCPEAGSRSISSDQLDGTFNELREGLSAGAPLPAWTKRTLCVDDSSRFVDMSEREAHGLEQYRTEKGGRIWLQHTRKSGGTSLCNFFGQKGNVRASYSRNCEFGFSPSALRTREQLRCGACRRAERREAFASPCDRDSRTLTRVKAC